jgi:DNA gyrase subunit A
VAGLLSFQPDENIAQVLAIRDYEQAPYLVLATRNGLVKKTRLGDYNSPRQAGVIAINFREDDDALIGAELVDEGDDILLVSRKGQAIRFRADESQLRPMGRATSGVTGMKFRDGDELLSMSVIRAEQVAAEEAAEQSAHEAGQTTEAGALPGVQEQYVFTITDGGFAKRSRISDYRLQSRGGIGIKAMKADGERGSLVGAFIVVEGDEVLAIKQSGQVTRSAIDEHLRPTGRDTKGVRFVGVNGGDSVVVVARSVERAPEIDEAVEEAVEAAGEVGDSGSVTTDATIESGAPVDGGPEPTDETDDPGTADPENEES